MVSRALSIVAFLLLSALLLVHAPQMAVEIPTHMLLAKVPEARASEANLLFVGDVMLGRSVEKRIREEGIEYPFAYTKDLLHDADLTFGNFEGVVPEKHAPAEPMTFQFSVRNEYLTHLKEVGFDVLSLANNHSLDYGEAALNYTRTLCEELRILCGGTPSGVGTTSIAVQSVHGINIGLLFLHTTFGFPDEDALAAAVAKLSAESDVQIAYIHWGDEYKLVHGAKEEKLAHTLIDAGIDAVVGHHPHVVEDVGLYQGKPIFYSLGNFIFDQYFSDDVQVGLGIEMHITGSHIRYTLIPFTSKETRNQPHIVPREEASALFERILEPIAREEGVDVAAGEIRLPRP